MERYICIDMGGTTIKYGIVDESLTISDAGNIPTNCEDYDLLFEDLCTIIEPYAESCSGITLSIPGSINAETGEFRDTGAIHCLFYQPLVADLKARFGLPVAAQNDGNCAALAEYHSGVGKGTKNMALIVLGTGIGGAVIVDGKLLKTKYHFSAEYGYMIMDYQDPRTWDELDGAVVPVTNKIKGSDERFAHMSGSEIFDLYRKDPVVTKHLDVFFRMLAIGCYNIQAILDPDLIVIAGGISSRDDFIGNLNDAVNALVVKPRLPDLSNIRVAHYRNNANLIGAYHNLASRLCLAGEQV